MESSLFSREERQLSNLCLAFIVLTTVVVVTRLYTRGVILKHLAVDDYAMVIAWLCYILTASLTLVIIAMVENLFKGEVLQIQKLMILVKIDTSFYICSLMMLKVSIGAFFLRIFSVHREQRWIVWFLLITNVAMSLVALVFSAATCGLDYAVLPGTVCPLWSAYALVSKMWSWYNALSDFGFSAVAIHALWSTQMSFMTRTYATMIICLGTAGGVCSMVRIVVISVSAAHESLTSALRYDEWSQIETAMGIMAACLATLRPLLRRLMTKSSANTFLSTTGAPPRCSTHAPRSMEMDDHPSKENQKTLKTPIVETSITLLLPDPELAHPQSIHVSSRGGDSSPPD